ncbi:MAG: OB-fold domain-containing protein [Alphaproteobacteria bacterium]|nr:OB-fold domain-containing protein [Alphaproteobacteria bacterium]MDX5370042.1 OB-fold domain-containing protein [Alphaproteobacteria bacterium]MDX5464616.1 OB-fold domain-containing protein [Alphaproteobacteria bacterium]
MTANDPIHGEGKGPDRIFRDALAEGKFLIQRSRSSGRCYFFPRLVEPGTGATDLEWIEASGEGTVYATTVVRNRPEKGGDHNVCMVDLKEGCRMMSTVVDIAPADVKIGMAVRARIDTLNGEPAVVFVPAGK